MKIQVFWDVTICRLDNSYWCVGRTYCIRRQDQAVELYPTNGHIILEHINLEHIPKCAYTPQLNSILELLSMTIVQRLYFPFRALSITNSQHPEEMSTWKKFKISTCFNPQGTTIREKVWNNTASYLFSCFFFHINNILCMKHKKKVVQRSFFF